MSVVYVCDRADCGVGALGSFDGYAWSPPAGWRSLILENWEVHGCCEDCFQAALDENTGRTPASSTREWAALRGIRFGPKLSPTTRVPRPNLEVPQNPPAGPPTS
jgi:hypothetical protein